MTVIDDYLQQLAPS